MSSQNVYTVYIIHGIIYIYTHAGVEQSLLNRQHYKSVAYQAVGLTLPKGYSSAFVFWFHSKSSASYAYFMARNGYVEVLSLDTKTNVI